MASMKDMSVSKGSDLTDIIGRVRLACKRDDSGAVTAAQYVRLSDESASALYLVVNITATRGAVSGETVLTLARLTGEGFPPVALISSRSPAPCNVARATDAEVVSAVRALAGEGVHLNPVAPRPARADRGALRPVEFDAECAPAVAGKCGTRGQRYEPLETVETVSILTADAGAGEWERAVEVASEVLATEPVTEPVTETPATEPSAEVLTVTETEPAPSEPAPAKGKRRKG